MNAWDTILTLVCLVVGVLLLVGKGDFFMGDKGAQERNKLYDMDKAQRGFGVMLILVGAATGINGYLQNTVVNIVYILVVVALFAGSVVYMRKFCKKQK